MDDHMKELDLNEMEQYNGGLSLGEISIGLFSAVKKAGKAICDISRAAYKWADGKIFGDK